MKTNAREYINFGKKCEINKRKLRVSLSMFGDGERIPGENVDASVCDVVFGVDVERLEIK